MADRQADDLRDLASGLAAYAAGDIWAGIGALQLMPDNADQIYRLQRFAGAALTLTTRDNDQRPRMSLSRWRRLVNTSPVADPHTRMMEDPYEEVWTESVVFFGGDYTVLNGVETNSAQTIRHLARAIFQQRGKWPGPFPAEAERVLRGVLGVSHIVCSRAELRRGSKPLSRWHQDVLVPDAARFRRLQEAVTISNQDLIQAVDADAAASLRRLASPSGEATASISDLRSQATLAPLVRTGGSTVVLLPGALLAAARNRVITLAQEHGCVPELAAQYRRAVQESAEDSLSMLRGRVLSTGLRQSTLPTRESVLALDSRLLCHLVVVTDDLREYNPLEAEGVWQRPRLGHQLARRLKAVRSWLRAQTANDLSILHILVHDFLGRSSFLGFDTEIVDEDSLLVSLRSSELDLLSRLDNFDGLALWKYARARERLRKTTQVRAFNMLDVFYVYWEHSRSFYFNDEARPDLLSLLSDTAKPLRLSDFERFDPHAVNIPGQGYKEVIKRYPGSGIPIYVTNPLVGRLRYVVEQFGPPHWVLADDAEDAGGWQQAMFCEAVTYWVWQIGRMAPGLLAAVPAHFVIRVAAKDPDASHPGGGGDRPGWLTISETPEGLHVHFGVGTGAAISGPDNAGERVLVRELVHALHRAGNLPVTDDAVEQVVQEVAPLGPKKMLMTVPLQGSPVLAENVPAPRLVDDADIQFWLDRLGEWLPGSVATGPIEAAEANDVLNRAVAFYFGELEAKVRDLRPEGLLENLIQQNEALQREQSERQLQLPTRVSCFAEEVSVVEELQKELPQLARSGIASRFLIEYVAAQPPEGGRELDRLEYDTLLALATEIADKGFLSDSIRFEISAPRLAALPSGRLGIGGADPMRDALKAYGSVQALDTLATAQVVFSSHWSELTTEPPDYLSDLEVAFREEFGASVSELMELVRALFDLATEGEGEPASVAEGEAVEALVAALGWDEDRVRSVLASLSLEPRGQFVPPKEGPDVYPWRFGRRLSYLRRPIVRRRRRDGSYELLWGTRNLYRFIPYLVELSVSGRLQARAPAMKVLMSRVRQRESEQFNDRVGEIVAGDVRTVRMRVKKVGELRIRRENGDDLGDIDVLVINSRTQTITAIETKDFELARTPVEWKHEIDKLLSGPGSAIQHHRERVDWLRRHQRAVLQWAEIPPGKKPWRVQGFVVTSRELITPLAQSADMSVVPVSRLAATPETYL